MLIFWYPESFCGVELIPKMYQILEVIKTFIIIPVYAFHPGIHLGLDSG